MSRWGRWRRGARRWEVVGAWLSWTALVVPVAVLSQPENGRPSSVQPSSVQTPGVQAASAPRHAEPAADEKPIDSPEANGLELTTPKPAASTTAAPTATGSESTERAPPTPTSVPAPTPTPTSTSTSTPTPTPTPVPTSTSTPTPTSTSTSTSTSTPTPAPPTAPPTAPGSSEDPETAPGWLDSQRLTVAQGMGGLIDRFDRFFGDDRRLDAESPSTRLKLKTFGRTAQDRDFSWGAGAAVSVHLPRLQRWLGNARLVVAGENTSSAVPLPPASDPLPDGEPPAGPPAEVAPTDLSRSRGRAELRFDMIRRGVLVFDTGAGVTFAWPPVPFARIRAHLRLGLPAGLVLRATEILFVELGGRGAGTSTDLLVERFFGASLRLRWEGHTVFAQRTRGAEWSTVAGAEWMVHRRTGLYGGVDAFGFGTPKAGLEAWRTFVGVRQDLRDGWIFAELEPELGWPRPAGQPRREVLAITLRLQVVIDSRPSVVGAASAPTQAR